MKQPKFIFSFFALSIATLSLTACDKADKKVETPSTTTSTTQTTAKTETTPIPASALTATTTATAITSTTATTAPLTVSGNTTAATATIDQVMSMMSSGMVMANKLAAKTDGKPKFSAEQIDCMATKGNENAVNEIQALLQQNFSEDEIKQMNDYYASPTGKRQSELTKNMIAVMSKDSKDTKAISNLQPTPQEQKDMAAFWKSPAGAKLEALLKDKEKLRPVMAKIIDKKQMDCNLPKGKG